MRQWKKSIWIWIGIFLISGSALAYAAFTGSRREKMQAEISAASATEDTKESLYVQAEKESRAVESRTNQGSSPAEEESQSAPSVEGAAGKEAQLSGKGEAKPASATKAQAKRTVTENVRTKESASAQESSPTGENSAAQESSLAEESSAVSESSRQKESTAATILRNPSAWSGFSGGYGNIEGTDFVPLPQPDEHLPRVREEENSTGQPQTEPSREMQRESSTAEIQKNETQSKRSEQESSSGGSEPKRESETRRETDVHTEQTSPQRQEDRREGRQDLVLLTEYTRADGSLYVSRHDFNLPDRALIGIKATGENNAKPTKLKWSDAEIARFKTAGGKELDLVAEAEEDLTINEINYGKVHVLVHVVFK